MIRARYLYDWIFLQKFKSGCLNICYEHEKLVTSISIVVTRFVFMCRKVLNIGGSDKVVSYKHSGGTNIYST